MKTIAITSCSKKKKTYTCTVREMYSDSYLFLSRRVYLDTLYNEWYVWDEDDGLLSPDSIIEPYGDFYITDHNQHSIPGETQVLSNERINKGLDVLKQQYSNTDDIIVHVHASEIFYDYLKKVFKNIIHIRPHKTFPTTAWKYHDALVMYHEGKSMEECNTFIDKREPKKVVEQPTWFHHNDHGSFYGKSSDLLRERSDVIPHHLAPSLWALSVGNINMTQGWVTNKDYLPYIKQNKTRWSLSKNAPGYRNVDRSHQRRGLIKSLLKLDSLK